MNVLVCDDIKRRGEKTRKEIVAATGCEPVLLSEKGLTTEIENLFERAKYVLKNAEWPAPATENQTSRFCSDFDIVILDNNLQALDMVGARHTAESIAGYVRAFGNIPYIVSLNKNPHVDFDLRYLVGDYQTQADLALNDKHLSNRALWTGDPKDATDGFLPWYWPALNDAAGRRREQIRFVMKHLDDRILDAMDFPASASDYLSRHAKGALSPEAVQVKRVTFKTFFVTSCRSLPIRLDRQKLSEMASESNTAREIVSCIVAAEMDRWIRRDLLGPQHVLVDLPHLLMRMPFVLGAKANNLCHWNEAATATEPPYRLSDAIYRNHLEGSRFGHDAWVKSPCFWWGTLKSNEEFNRMFFRDKSEWAGAVFCEDLSRFKLTDEEANSAPMEFAAEFEGSWNRRHVAVVKGKNYTPKSRLAK